MNYRSLPPKIATHFDWENKPDGWMTPYGWALTSISTVVVLSLIFAALYTQYSFGAKPYMLPALVLFYMGLGVVTSAFHQVVTISRNGGTISLPNLLFSGIAGLTYGFVMAFLPRLS